MIALRIRRDELGKYGPARRRMSDLTIRYERA